MATVLLNYDENNPKAKAMLDLLLLTDFFKIAKKPKVKAQSFDFEKEWENGIAFDEARKHTHDFIESLPWKK